ncbi:unnamed protein product [Zymoseptoria tritici ST99CH_3D7]|uniref:Uncharacterized protein n=1 Tax=Zymoseptoria tritici (strain ST99CH_3D7) TaxID=1276538 RepID=A0A1X7RIQ7_ZYMT9|nr:unnamed protein product [Zymoseptoria tritici ST99CH_3D7]
MDWSSEARVSSWMNISISRSTLRRPEIIRLEEDSGSDNKDGFKSILPYKLEGWDKARLCNDRSTSFINLKQHVRGAHRIRIVATRLRSSLRLRPNTAGSSKPQRRLAASLVIFPATPKKRGREEDVNETPEEDENPFGHPRTGSKSARTPAEIAGSKPGFPVYKGNVKSKKKRGNKGGEVIHRKGDVKYSEAIAHCKTIWNKAFPCAICKDLGNAECFEIKECLGWDLFSDGPKLRDQINWGV